jgi:hypothetical protein
MLLANAFSGVDPNAPPEDNLGLKFVIQDRGIVVDMGLDMWKAKCPELLENGIATFQGALPLFHTLDQTI